MNEIPESVLTILESKWKPHPGYSAFDSVFGDNEDRQRRIDPSYCHISVGKEIEYDIDVFTHAEAKDLVKDGVFGSLAVSRETEVSINEHAQNALTDFCSEVYAAWEKYNHRIKEVENIGVYP